MTNLDIISFQMVNHCINLIVTSRIEQNVVDIDDGYHSFTDKEAGVFVGLSETATFQFQREIMKEVAWSLLQAIDGSVQGKY